MLTTTFLCPEGDEQRRVWISPDEHAMRIATGLGMSNAKTEMILVMAIWRLTVNEEIEAEVD